MDINNIDRKDYKNIITFRLVNVKTGEIEYEFKREYDLYYTSNWVFFYHKLDNFLRKVINQGSVGSYSIEFISSERSKSDELPLPF